MRFIASIILILSCLVASGANLTNAPTYSATSNNVALASDGDTIWLTAGTATWNNELSTTKAVSIIGAGTNSTIITNTLGSIFKFKPASAQGVRLSGITFIGQDNQNPVILCGPITNARVDHCFFNKGDCAVAVNFLEATGPVYGVIDNCTFLNMKRPIFSQDVRVGEGLSGTTSWAEPVLPGTQQLLYVETCQFLWDANLTDGNAQCALYGQYGGRVCFRYNVCSNFSTYIDAHGDNPDLATRFFEVYSNTFNVDYTINQQGNVFGLRGGTHIIHDNIITGNPSGGAIQLTVYWETDAEERRVRNTYLWNNNRNGDVNQSNLVYVADSGQTSAGYSSNNIIINRDYFLAAPAEGQTFYPYTPLEYPHPLVAAQDGAAPESPEAPAVSTRTHTISGTINIGTLRRAQ